MFNPYKSVPVCCMCVPVITSHCYYSMLYRSFFLMLFEDGMLMAMQILVRYLLYLEVLSLKRGMRANQSWILDLIDTKTQVMISMSMNETRGKCNEHVQCFSLSYKYAFCDHLLRFIWKYQSSLTQTTRVDIADHREQLSSLF